MLSRRHFTRVVSAGLAGAASPALPALASALLTSARPSDLRFSVARAVLEHFDDFMRLHAAFAPLDPREMVHAASRAPLHCGAEHYDRERGWLP